MTGAPELTGECLGVGKLVRDFPDPGHFVQMLDLEAEVRAEDQNLSK